MKHEKISIVDFTDRFKNYAVKIAKHYPQLSVNFLTDLQNERVLTPELSLNLFRIMQEALQNACKHSLASEIIIGFKSTDTIKLFVIKLTAHCLTRVGRVVVMRNEFLCVTGSLYSFSDVFGPVVNLML